MTPPNTCRYCDEDETIHCDEDGDKCCGNHCDDCTTCQDECDEWCSECDSHDCVVCNYCDEHGHEDKSCSKKQDAIKKPAVLVTTAGGICAMPGCGKPGIHFRFNDTWCCGSHDGTKVSTSWCYACAGGAPKSGHCKHYLLPHLCSLCSPLPEPTPMQEKTCFLCHHQKKPAVHITGGGAPCCGEHQLPTGTCYTCSGWCYNCKIEAPYSNSHVDSIYTDHPCCGSHPECSVCKTNLMKLVGIFGLMAPCYWCTKVKPVAHLTCSTKDPCCGAHIGCASCIDAKNDTLPLDCTASAYVPKPIPQFAVVKSISGAKAAAPAVVTWPLSVSMPGLSQPSTSVYTSIQLRVLSNHDGHTQVRWQTAGNEGDFPVSTIIGDWIAKRPHEEKSTAGTAMMYCRARARHELDSKVRIQIEGPEVNRPWGLTMVVHAPSLVHTTHTTPPGGELPTPVLKVEKLPGWTCANGEACLAPKYKMLSLCKSCIVNVKEGKGEGFGCHACCADGGCDKPPIYIDTNLPIIPTELVEALLKEEKEKG